MISAVWKMDAGSDTEFLECRNDEFVNEPRERIDTVKVYFNNLAKIEAVKENNWERKIALAIFANRERYGSIINVELEIFLNCISLHSKVTTNIMINCCEWPNKK